MLSARVQALFVHANTLEPEDRDRFLTDACGDDRELYEEVSSLLAAANESEDYFERLSGKFGMRSLAEDEPSLPADTVLGQWRIVRLLGHGGMGSVYLAERADGQFEKRAALKMLPVGPAGTQARDRFIAERQILARLVHDNIARLLDGGITDDGAPYFVMDYVEGLPIDEYCRRHELSVRERLELLLDVARATQFAHRNLIVHRDLKPANVLVELGGRVRLLDFGIAKVIEPSDEPAALTRVTQRPVTPAFASPEMLRGEAVDVTTDVYSIGVLAYLLLTDRLPLHYDGLSLSEMHARAAEDAPPPPSRLNDTLDGELDAIIGKALEKRPAERYASVEALANDIRNYLEGLPVSARVPTAFYRARKFLRRHVLAASFAAFAVLALAAIAGLAGYAALTAERQSLAIALERDRAEQIAAFLVGIFDSADPNVTAPDLTAREILDAGRQRIGETLGDQPELQVELLKTIGDVYGTLRLTAEGREARRSELALRERLDGIDSPEYVDTLVALSELEDVDGDYELSLEYAERALAIADQSGNRPGEAAAHLRIGRVLHLQGDYEGADAGYRRALEICEAEFGADAPSTDKVRLFLATLLNHREQYEESLSLLQQVLATRQGYYDGDHGEFTEVYLAMGSVLAKLGRYGDAQAIYERSHAMNDRLFGPDNNYNLFVVNGLGKVAEETGNYALAAERYAEAVRLLGLHYPDHPNLGIGKSNLARAHALQGRHDLAVPLYREAVEIAARHLPDHWMLGRMRVNLGDSITRSGGDLDEAEALILTGLARLTDQWGAGHATTRAAREAAAHHYEIRGRPEDAAKYMQRAAAR